MYVRKIFLLIIAVSFVASFDAMPLSGQEPLNKRLNKITTAPAALFHVSARGNDQWSGKLAIPNANQTDGPFLTLTKARDALRVYRKNGDVKGPFVIEIHEGNYELDQSLSLGKADEGTEDAPVIWRAAPGEHPRLIGGKFVNHIEPVTDQAVLARMNPSADRSKLFQADLKALGVKDYGTPIRGITPYLNGKPMHLARYPDTDMMVITGFAPEAEPFLDHPMTQELTHQKIITQVKKQGFFTTNDREILKWKNEEDVRLFGYWFRNWAFCNHELESIDPASLTIRVKPPYHYFGYWKGQKFYAFNLLCELDAPGEYYIDRKAGKLYFYAEQKPTKDSMILATLPQVVGISGKNIVLQGLTLESSIGYDLAGANCDGLILAGCTFRNASLAGARISGMNMTVFGCEFYQLDGGCLTCLGGDRKTLTPANSIIANNDFHDYNNAVAISIGGVGIQITNNRIHDAQANGISFGGNEHVMEYNELCRIVKYSNDAGSIYCWGTWTTRGNVIRYNYLYDTHGLDKLQGVKAIYIDGTFSSVDVIGNIMIDFGIGIAFSGGHNNRAYNNVIVNTQDSLRVIPGLKIGWKYIPDMRLKEFKDKGTVDGVKWNEPPYITRYPGLKNMPLHPYVPMENAIERNIITEVNFDTQTFGKWQPFHQYLATWLALKEQGTKGVIPSGLWKGVDMDGPEGQWLSFKDNFIGGDPKFVDPGKNDYRLREDSPVWKLGFKRIPTEKIGTYKHPLNAFSETTR